MVSMREPFDPFAFTARRGQVRGHGDHFRREFHIVSTLKEYRVSEVGNLKIHGRTAGKTGPVPLFWTASGFEVNVTGSELWVELEGDYGFYEPWVSTRVNGAWVSRQMVNKGRQWVCLFRGRSPAAVKNVRLWKDAQACHDDPNHLLQVHGFRTDGEFLPVADRPLKLEFIGDSITSGEGNIGALAEEDWVAMLFSAENDYAVMTADLLNADVRLLSQSGWGVVTSWDNNPHFALPDYYGEVCGVLTGERNRALGALEPNDFAAWQPDAVVVNLGTNDNGAFSQPEWRDMVTGETFQQRRRPDGSFEPADLRRFQLAVIAFLKKLRQYNPRAYLLWVFGMLGTELGPAIDSAVREYAQTSGDKRVSYLELTDAVDKRGARFHPGRAAHELAAGEIAEFLKTVLK